MFYPWFAREPCRLTGEEGNPQPVRSRGTKETLTAGSKICIPHPVPCCAQASSGANSSPLSRLSLFGIPFTQKGNGFYPPASGVHGETPGFWRTEEAPRLPSLSGLSWNHGPLGMRPQLAVCPGPRWQAAWQGWGSDRGFHNLADRSSSPGYVVWTKRAMLPQFLYR